MGKEQRALIRLKTQTLRIKTALFHPLCLASYVLCLLLIFSADVFPADEGQNAPDSNEAEQVRSVSISTGPNGKVTWIFERNLGTAHGDAVVKYDDIVLKADHIWADLNTEVVEAQGNVILEMQDQTIEADHMLFDLRNKKGTMQNGVSFDDPWYNSGKKMSRFSSEETFIEKGSMTSCSLDHPHYSFEASQIIVHLKKELIAKHVILKIGGVPVLYLPVYRRSLEPDKPARFIFKIGSNTFEGYYVKNILPVHWRMINGSVFLNYTSRRGNNGGLEFDYDADKVKLREIFLPIPEDASYEERKAVKDKMEEILSRAEGELDKIWLKQLFIRFQIGEADRERAHETAQEALEKCREENADFAQLARRWSDDKDTKSIGGRLGSFVVGENGISLKKGKELIPVAASILPVIEAALKLEPGQISDLLGTEEGYHIVKLDKKEAEAISVSHIFIAFQPSGEAQEAAQKKADDILTKLSEGSKFEDIAKTYSDDSETRDNGGDLGWKTFKELDIGFHSAVRILNKGEVSRLITTSQGIYIIKLEDKEKTPDFADLAKEYSQAPSAKMGGDIGHKSRWELSPKVAREAFRLEIGGISNPVESDDGYRIVKVEKKRRLLGDVYTRYGDLYSYQTDENPIKLGQTWDINIHHQQTLWRGDEQYDPASTQQRIRKEKELSMRAEVTLAGKEFKEVYQSYNPERELKSYCAIDYHWMSRPGHSGRARFVVDATRDLLGEDTGQLQKYPEITFSSPSYQLQEITPFKQINSGLRFVSGKAQGKEDFAKLVSEVSDDLKTKDTGGDLGWFRKGESGMGSKVEGDLFDPYKMALGEISEPIKVSDGYHIVKLEEIEERDGQRERVRARHIFIAAAPEIRTNEEARAIARTAQRKLTEGERPSLGFLTLDNTSFSFDIEAGNYYKDKYRDEENIWLQTAYTSASLNKRAIIRLGISRELNLTLNGNYSQSWHSKTQPLGNTFYLETGEELPEGLDLNKRNRNVFSNAWNGYATLSTNIHRIYHPTYIPGVYALRHTINPSVNFSYAPLGQLEEDNDVPKIYPFGRASWSYEQKDLSVNMTNSIDIKTKRKREKLSLLRWTSSAGARYTEEEDSDQRYNYIRNTFILKPHKQFEFTNVFTHNPNNIGNDGPLLWSFNSDLKYTDSKRRWTGYLRRQSAYNQYYKEWRQYFKGKCDLRWSKTWNLSLELEYEYDDSVKDINYTKVALHRMLHCWESSLVFSRRGTKAGYIRRDFYFQIDLIADPGKALGVGYDDIADSWTLRSLPGMGRVGGFLRSGSSGYY